MFSLVPSCVYLRNTWMVIVAVCGFSVQSEMCCNFLNSVTHNIAPLPFIAYLYSVESEKNVKAMRHTLKIHISNWEFITISMWLSLYYAQCLQHVTGDYKWRDKNVFWENICISKVSSQNQHQWMNEWWWWRFDVTIENGNWAVVKQINRTW